MSDVAYEVQLDAHRAAIDHAIAQIADEVRGADVVSEAMRYALATGGKRLRPILCLAAMEAVGAAPLTAHHIRAAASIELVHTYSLVHDDLPCMDDDELRRGRPTTHRVHGVRAAVVAGFALIPLACRVLGEAAAACGTPPDTRRDAIRELCAGAGAAGMVAGQLLDLEAEGSAPGIEGLRRIHAHKTGALFRASVRIGGLIAGAGPGALEAFARFGDRLGLAFQITDDVLDVTMDAAALGKTPGKDEGAGKPTFASLLGVAGAQASARAEADAAIRALREHGLGSALLEGIAGFAVDRRR